MRDRIPFKRIFRIALITTPLLGLFGAAPLFAIPRNNFERLEEGFITVTLMICAFWAIHIWLLSLWEKFNLESKSWVRYIIGITICATGVIVLIQFLPPVGGRFQMQTRA